MLLELTIGKVGEQSMVYVERDTLTLLDIAVHNLSYPLVGVARDLIPKEGKRSTDLLQMTDCAKLLPPEPWLSVSILPVKLFPTKSVQGHVVQRLGQGPGTDLAGTLVEWYPDREPYAATIAQLLSRYA